MLTSVFVAAALVASAAAAPSAKHVRRQSMSTATGYASEKIGCFQDFYPTSRAMPALNYTSDSMTLESCNNFCGSRGYTYAGTEYARECYCSNEQPTSPLDDSKCSFQCSGNGNEICGGDNAISLVKLTPTYSTGCQVDDINYRSLDGASFTSSSMTVELCSSFCASRGFSLAGTEYASECYCGNVLRLNGPATCDMACSGNSAEICGGGNALSVVSTSAADQPNPMPQFSSFGCYTDYYPDYRALNGAKYYADDMTVEKCAMHCQSTGANYFGLEYARECYCGSSLQPAVRSNGCDTPCSGNANEICGGGNALSVYYYPSKVSGPSNMTSSAARRL